MIFPKNFSTINYIFLLLFLITASSLYAQNIGAVKGKIISDSGQPLSNANIIVEGTNVGTSTDENGYFFFDKLPLGELVLTVTCIGYKTERKKITVTGTAIQEITIILEETSYDFNDVVVTGTRTQRRLKDTPVRTEIINEEELKQNGFLKLTDVLIEQTGLAVIQDHGEGIQVQGLDPAYTLILIDGEPVIGRTAGTLDLDRFEISDLKRIEIVKGPSSSLYGSEALAGVINLITRKPSQPVELRLKAIIGTHNTYNLNAGVNLLYDKLGFSLNAGSVGSSGYDLTEETISQTAPEYNSYNINPRLEYKFSSDFSMELNGRFYYEAQENKVEVTENEQISLLNSDDDLIDWSSSLTAKYSISKKLKTEATFYTTRYLTESSLKYSSDNSTYDYSRFDQHLYKSELFGNYIYNTNHISSFGVGYLIENVEAGRIAEGTQQANSYYTFVQHEWIASEIFDFVIGARFDSHSNYSSRLSPKLSVMFTPYQSLRIRGSFGSGFKAPTLQQLYLDFTNPQVGYSVFGAANFQAAFDQLKQEGQIERVLLQPGTISEIGAENSVAFNFGIEYSPFEFFDLSVNLFRNDVKDLIEAAPIAVKTNGQSVYTYLNYNKIFTQGIESQVRLKPNNELCLAVGYQYLEAKDEEVIDKIKVGEISTVTPSGRIRPVTMNDYGGLFNRSTHSGTVRLIYENDPLGFSVNLSGIIKGKYGFGDINGNGILDNENEYVKGYAVWNIALSKQLPGQLNALIRIENIFDKTNTSYIPSMPGRIIYAGINLEFSK